MNNGYIAKYPSVGISKDNASKRVNRDKRAFKVFVRLVDSLKNNIDQEKLKDLEIETLKAKKYTNSEIPNMIVILLTTSLGITSMVTLYAIDKSLFKDSLLYILPDMSFINIEEFMKFILVLDIGLILIILLVYIHVLPLKNVEVKLRIDCIEKYILSSK